MKRTILLHVPADRHAEVHERQFSWTARIQVDAGAPLLDQIAAALEQVGLDDAPERLTVTLEDPFE